MAKQKIAKEVEAVEGFDWEMYDDGFSSHSKVNSNITTKSGARVYSHAAYAQELANKYDGIDAPSSKELSKHSLVEIDDITSVSNDKMLVSINKGSNNIIIDLAKEQKFFNIIKVGDDKLTKDTFAKYIQVPEFRKQILEMGLSAKIGTDVEKASLWDGYVEKLSNELRDEITKNSKAYTATILSSNHGGFVVNVANAVKAFMPGSMAAANKIEDYDSLVGQTMEVMVESWNPKYGFVVSRKKYLSTIVPIAVKEFEKTASENPTMTFKGRVTGTKPFGIFVELTEVLTGMLHKTLLSDELREKLRNNQIEAGTEIDVYLHKVEYLKGNDVRIILSDVEPSKRDEVIAKREAEDAKEKSEYMTSKKTVEPRQYTKKTKTPTAE